MPAFPPHWRRGALRALGFVFALVMLAACDAGDPPAPGSVQGRVTGEGAPLAGVTVELTGAANRVATTDADGRFTFSQVPVGAYVVSIRDLPPDAAFSALSRTASVTSAGTVNVDFQGTFIRTASISGTVRARTQGVGGVTVTLLGPENASDVTSGDGSFSFPALRTGLYEVEISGFPASIDFPSTRTTVDLQPGQAHEAIFEGIPDLTATVVLRSLQRVLPDGTRVPADPLQLQGTIEVGVTLDRGGDTPDSVTVFLGSEVVGKQRFTELEAGLAPAPLELVFTVATDAFDPQTGLARFLNGERLLTVRLATREGGPSASTASAQVRLDNRDTFTARIFPERGPELAPGGTSWVGGDLRVEVLPVFYSPGRTLSAVTLDYRTAAGGTVARRSAVGSPPLSVTFGTQPATGGSLAGYTTPPGEGDRLVVVDARYGDGGVVPGLPLPLEERLRVDQEPPTVTRFALPRQAGTTTCCLENWVGAEFLFEAAVEGLADTGIGVAAVRVHAGAAGLSDEDLLALPPVTRGSDLDATPGNAAYRALLHLEDLLGNARTVPLAPSSGNPLSGPGGAVFGVDRTPPTVRLASGGTTLPERSVNPPADAAWGLVAEAAGSSGFGTLPILATVRRFGPGDPEGGSCVEPPGDPDCVPVVSGLVHPVPSGTGPGYLRLEARALDRAGNRSTPVEAWVLRDTDPPVVGALLVTDALVGGTEARVAFETTDGVDLSRARLLAAFPGVGEGGAELVLPVASPLLPLGTPFSGTRVTSASPQVTFPHLAGVQRAASGPGGTGAGGVVAPVTRFEGRVEDAAGNVGTRSTGLPAPPAGSLTGFDAGARGAAAAVRRWEVAGDAGTVCRAEAECAVGTPAEVLFEARASGESDAFPNPFVRVHFFALGPDARWLGSTADTRVEPGELGGEPLSRVWSLAWTPPADFPSGGVSVLAVGMDTSGNGLVVATPFVVNVLP
jgi:hypothetical protein